MHVRPQVIRCSHGKFALPICRGFVNSAAIPTASLPCLTQLLAGLFIDGEELTSARFQHMSNPQRQYDRPQEF